MVVCWVFLLPAFTRLGHECKDLLSPCDGMHVSTDWTSVYTLIPKSRASVLGRPGSVLVCCDSKFDLRLPSQCGSMCNRLSRSVLDIRPRQRHCSCCWHVRPLRFNNSSYSYYHHYRHNKYCSYSSNSNNSINNKSSKSRSNH